jgi:hypothetical protein
MLLRRVTALVVKLGVRWPGDTDAVPMDRDANPSCDPGQKYSERKLVCEVPRAVSAQLQTEAFSLTLRKPGNSSMIAFIMQAMGEDPFIASVSSSSTLCAPDENFDDKSANCNVVAAHNNASANVSAYGLCIDWFQGGPADHRQVSPI